MRGRKGRGPGTIRLSCRSRQPAQPGWRPLLGIVQRACALVVQVALSAVVLQVFRRGQIRWLWLAVLAHAVVDSAVVLLPLTPLGTTAQTVIGNALLLFGLAALWVIRALREPAPAPVAPPHSPETHASSSSCQMRMLIAICYTTRRC